MGGLSSFSNSSSSCIDVEVGVFDECEERLRSLFNQALLVFLEEEDNTNRPLPAVLGDGERVDLFKLFVLVREREGFDSVSRKGLWESVAEKLGFDCSVSPSLRLVYSKYLDRMEKWAMETSRDVDWDNQESEKKGCHEGLLHELGAGFKGLLQTGSCGKRNRAMGFGCKHIEESGSELRRPRKRLRKSRNDDDDKGVEASCVVLGAEEDGSNLSSKKEGDISEMLKWLTLAARCPHDPSIGEIPHWSEWNEHTGNEWWIQAATAKNSLLAKRELVPTPVNFDRVPSLYSTVRLRHFIRRPNVSEGCFGSCSNGSLVSPTESGSSNCLGTSTALVVYIKPNPGNWNRKVNVGRRFQARVDEWTEPVLDSDTKWLGTCIWPLEKKDHTLGDDFIGKGRPDGCSCDILHSGSVECTRFHIAEKRMELKRELGDVFLRWRFNEMGEEVALRWTEREEKRFKEKIISGYKSFWKKAGKKFFRRKKREQLVSYYFNVFVINRRRYQNRVTPREIDSDDEGPFGLVGNGYGRDAVHMFGSGNMICTESRQCNDY